MNIGVHNDQTMNNGKRRVPHLIPKPPMHFLNTCCPVNSVPSNKTHPPASLLQDHVQQQQQQRQEHYHSMFHRNAPQQPVLPPIRSILGDLLGHSQT